MKPFYLFNNRILSHITFWVFILLFYTFFQYFYEGHFFQVLKTNLFYLPQDIISVYFVLYVLFPKYLVKYKFLPFLFFSILTIIFLTSVSAFVTYIILPSLELYLPPISLKEQLSNTIFALSGITGMAATIKYIRLSLLHQFQRTNIAIKQMETELKYLKSQINPHFLFNSLNNIDELIYSNKEKASKAIFHLSEILRYVLKETETNKVLVKKELEFTRNYIDFVRLSFKDKNFIKISIKGILLNKEIPPLLFLPVIENAVKYVDRKAESPGIVINFNFNPKSIEFACKNKFSNFTNKQNQNGIGLRNLKRRLELLYHESYNLTISAKEQSYIVELKIFES